jgi:hypothetical protein
MPIRNPKRLPEGAEVDPESSAPGVKKVDSDPNGPKKDDLPSSESRRRARPSLAEMEGVCPDCGGQMVDGKCPDCGYSETSGQSGPTKEDCPECGGNLVEGTCEDCGHTDRAPIRARRLREDEPTAADGNGGNDDDSNAEDEPDEDEKAEAHRVAVRIRPVFETLFMKRLLRNIREEEDAAADDEKDDKKDDMKDDDEKDGQEERRRARV